MTLTRRLTFKNLQPAFSPELAVKQTVRLPIGADLKAGQTLGCVSGPAANDLKTFTITGSPTGGSWTFSLLGLSSDPISFNATASQVQTVADKFFGAGTVVVSGGPGPGSPYTFTFVGSMGNALVKGITVTGSFTGGTTPAITVANTTPGSAGAGQYDAYNDLATNGTQVARAILAIDYKSDVNGGIQTETGGTGQPHSGIAYFAGFFKCADMLGVDANGVADLGRLVVGTAYTDQGAVIKL